MSVLKFKKKSLNFDMYILFFYFVAFNVSKPGHKNPHIASFCVHVYVHSMYLYKPKCKCVSEKRDGDRKSIYE